MNIVSQMIKSRAVRALPALTLTALITGGCAAPAAAPPQAAAGLKVVSTLFPGYDFARQAAGAEAQVTLLLPPGAESHSYEPTPADILAVQQCDVFIYLGGESDRWVETILEAAAPAGQVLSMMDCVETLEEVYTEGMDTGHDHEYEEAAGHGGVTEIDEHVWTAPNNAAAITRQIGETLSAADPAGAAGYRERAEGYAQEIEALGAEFAAFFETMPPQPLVFGDRFPLRYFAEEYGLSYYAAFPGCTTQTEPSAATVAFLTDKVRQEGISTVWYIEFSNHLVADAIAEAAGAETALFHSCHNVSRREIEAGESYVTLMRGNLERLRQHLGGP